MAFLFVSGAFLLAVTFLAVFFGAGFDFLLAAFLAAAFAAFSSSVVNCLTRFSVSLISFYSFFNCEHHNLNYGAHVGVTLTPQLSSISVLVRKVQ